jgi:hypothetical protein
METLDITSIAMLLCLVSSTGWFHIQVFRFDSNKSMAWWSWLSFTVSLYYQHSPESNVSLSMSRATMCASSRWQQVRWYKSVWHFMLVCFNWRAFGRLHVGIYFQHHKLINAQFGLLVEKSLGYPIWLGPKSLQTRSIIKGTCDYRKWISCAKQFPPFWSLYFSIGPLIWQLISI